MKEVHSQLKSLRHRSERRLKASRAAKGGPRAGDDTLRLFHELQVHQIELELQNEELNQANMAGQHEKRLPDLSLSGKFLQHNNTVDNGQRVDYSFQLSLTDLHTGLALWEDEKAIAKLGTNATVAW